MYVHVYSCYIRMGDGVRVYMYTYVYSVKTVASVCTNLLKHVYRRMYCVCTFMFFMCTCIQLRERDREIELCERRGRESRASQRDTDPLGAARSS